MFIYSRFLSFDTICVHEFQGKSYFFDTNQDYVSCVDLNIATHVKSYTYMLFIQLLSTV